MNFANFDNLIAKRNVNRYIETGKIDLSYLENATGADAVNQISRILENSTDVDNVKMKTRRLLEEKYEELNEENMDYRNFNISKKNAKNLLEKKYQ